MNGLIEQWGRIGAEREGVNPGDSHSETVNLLITYTSQTSFISFVTSGKGLVSGDRDVGAIGVYNTSGSSILISGARTYYPWKWLTKGY